ncbi:MAG: hypothetical protein VX641_01030 [Planctomycetota bacterium]|nr:hypothetical protein [Planctomycetota bacterium]
MLENLFNAPFVPVMITMALWLGVMIMWCITCFWQSKRDRSRGVQYPDHSNQ